MGLMLIMNGLLACFGMSGPYGAIVSGRFRLYLLSSIRVYGGGGM
jgi:hypothetical protein